jgi:hypothetical protein
MRIALSTVERRTAWPRARRAAIVASLTLPDSIVVESGSH